MADSSRLASAALVQHPDADSPGPGEALHLYSGASTGECGYSGQASANWRCDPCTNAGNACKPPPAASPPFLLRYWQQASTGINIFPQPA